MGENSSMTNAIADVIKAATDAASGNPYVAGGMVVGGIIIAIGGWIYKKRKERKAGKK